MKWSALGNVHRLAWSHENAIVRLTALTILVKGSAEICDKVEDFSEENVELWRALREAGCEFTHGGIEKGFYWYSVTCDGAKECYGNGSLFDID